MRTRLAVSFPLVLLLLLASPTALHAYGPNLISNPGFATGTGSWNNALNATWKAIDSDGDVNSGSAYLAFAGIGGIYGPNQCVNVTAGAKYAYSGSVWVPSSNNAGVKPAVVVYYSDAPACGHLGTNFIVTYGSTQRDVWNDVTGVVTVPAGFVSAQIWLGALGPNGASVTAYIDNLFFATGACAPTATKLCLSAGRFEVSVSWETTTGTGAGQAVPFASESGSFWFFSPTNLEVDVKVLNGCAINNRYWVFIAGLTNVHTVMTVRDTKTGGVKTYNNPQGQVFKTVTDTNAFATCP